VDHVARGGRLCKKQIISSLLSSEQCVSTLDLPLSVQQPSGVGHGRMLNSGTRLDDAVSRQVADELPQRRAVASPGHGLNQGGGEGEETEAKERRFGRREVVTFLLVARNGEKKSTDQFANFLRLNKQTALLDNAVIAHRRVLTA
jgi:hypothetical protein